MKSHLKPHIERTYPGQEKERKRERKEGKKERGKEMVLQSEDPDQVTLPLRSLVFLISQSDCQNICNTFSNSLTVHVKSLTGGCAKNKACCLLHLPLQLGSPFSTWGGIWASLLSGFNLELADGSAGEDWCLKEERGVGCLSPWLPFSCRAELTVLSSFT